MDNAVVVAYFTSVLILNLQNFNSCDAERKSLELSPEHPSMYVAEGESIHVGCTCTPHILVNYCVFKWERHLPNNTDDGFKLISSNLTERIHQLKSQLDTKTLVIRRAKLEDSGKYVCLFDGIGTHMLSNRTLLINVTTINPKLNCDKVFECSERRKISCDSVCDGRQDCANRLDEINCVANSKLNCDKVFECSEKRKISCDSVCDGRQDCANGLDEQNCTNDMCYGKFRCKNGLCIDKKLVCDLNAKNHCGDSSDEENCPEITDNIEIFTKDPQMDWLKTTVYTVIACTVSVVLMIAIIVVAIFRIRMKRAAIRRAMRHVDRRQRHDRHDHRYDGHRRHSARSLRNSVVEHEPFISAPSSTHFGNIIVNVNNGVQFLPNTDFRSLVQGPPSYSEVLAMESAERHSPPPDYSTIDRNPRNADGIPALVEGSEHSHTETEGPVIRRVNNDCDSSDTRGGQPTQSFSANDLQVTSLGAASRPECTNSLGRRNHSQAGSRDRLVRNVRAHPLPQRPKQLQVRNGQIVLDGNSSGSSSPETVNRNTQTNLAELRSIRANLTKPGQLQVERGQIILSDQSDRDTGDLDYAGACSVQGQLEVKEGQIVFKAT